MCILPVYFEGSGLWCFHFSINILPFYLSKKKNISCAIKVICQFVNSLHSDHVEAADRILYSGEKMRQKIEKQKKE